MNQNSTTTTRRRFLEGVAGALALPVLIPSAALGRDGAVAPSERILMGGIGLGGRGSSDLKWMMGESDVQFRAVCDVRKSQRGKLKQLIDRKYGTKDCATYLDIRQFLATGIDLLIKLRRGEPVPPLTHLPTISEEEFESTWS